MPAPCLLSRSTAADLQRSETRAYSLMSSTGCLSPPAKDGQDSTRWEKKKGSGASPVSVGSDGESIEDEQNTLEPGISYTEGLRGGYTPVVKA